MPDATHMLAALQPTKENLGSAGIGNGALPQAAFDFCVTGGSRLLRVARAVTPQQAMELELRGLDVDALAAYSASGTDDWTRDLTLLTEKVEVEALGPQRLRVAVITAIEEALDPGRAGAGSPGRASAAGACRQDARPARRVD